jgi:hypothetical protein
VVQTDLNAARCLSEVRLRSPAAQQLLAQPGTQTHTFGSSVAADRLLTVQEQRKEDVASDDSGGGKARVQHRRNRRWPPPGTTLGGRDPVLIQGLGDRGKGASACRPAHDSGHASLKLADRAPLRSDHRRQLRADIGNDHRAPVNLNFERRWGPRNCVRKIASNLVGQTGDLEPLLKTLSERLDHVCVRPDALDRHRRIRKPPRRTRTTQAIPATLRYRLPSNAVKRRNHPILIPNQPHERHQTASMLIKNNENLVQIHRTRLLLNAAKAREALQKYLAGAQGLNRQPLFCLSLTPRGTEHL